MRVFEQEGWLYRFLDRLWDILILNLLFIVTSLPFITIGTSLSALYSVALKAVKREESYICRSYLSAWKENFGASAILWIIFAAAGIILGIDIFVIGKDGGIYGKALVFAGGICGVVWILMGIYLFPLQARFENSVPNTILNAILVAVKFLPATIQLIGIFAMVPLAAIALGIWAPTVFKWGFSFFCFFGFSGIAFVSSFIYRRVFDKLAEEQNTELDKVHNE